MQIEKREEKDKRGENIEMKRERRIDREKDRKRRRESDTVREEIDRREEKTEKLL